MRRTYRAVLRGDRVEWIDAPPERSDPTPVQITLEDGGVASVEERRRVVSETLAVLARGGGLSGIGDPVSWQREERRDRPLERDGDAAG